MNKGGGEAKRKPFFRCAIAHWNRETFQGKMPGIFHHTQTAKNP